MTDNLVERLREIDETSDHERGCDGRHYSCSCGYEERVQETAKLARAEIAAMKIAGTSLANAAYNIRQGHKIDDRVLNSLAEAYIAWDRASLATDSTSLSALLAETRKNALEEARKIINGLLTAYVEADEDGLTGHAEPIIAARAFLRSLSNEESPK